MSFGLDLCKIARPLIKVKIHEICMSDFNSIRSRKIAKITKKTEFWILTQLLLRTEHRSDAQL
jgi:hypothetical protein